MKFPSQIALDLNKFLSHSKKQFLQNIYTNKNKLNIHIIFGNEAADADSIISPIVYANLKKKKNLNQNILYLPILSIPRNQLTLRSEIISLFNILHIDINEICFSDEINLNRLYTLYMDRLHVTLVDHNKVNDNISFLSNRIVEIIDHHEDLHEYIDTIPLNHTLRKIAFDPTNKKPLVGSCCTLITEEFMLLKLEPSPIEATLLLGVITLDTVNMDRMIMKGTKRDEEAILYLSNYSLINRNELFTFLQTEKYNMENWIHNFSFQNCLIYDFKIFFSKNDNVKYGISSILINVFSLLKKVKDNDEIFNQLKTFCSQQDIMAFFIMSIDKKKESNENGIQRELLFFSLDSKIFMDWNTFLKDNMTLQLVEFNYDDTLYTKNNFLRIYKQNNASISRKIFVPILNDVF